MEARGAFSLGGYHPFDRINNSDVQST